MATPKLTLISGIYPPDKGGPAQFVSEFSNWVSKKGWSVKVVSLTDDKNLFIREKNKTISLISRNQNIFSRMSRSVLIMAKPIFSKRILLVNGKFLESLVVSFIPGTKIVSKVPGDIVWERARNQGSTKLDIDSYQGNESRKMKFFRFLFSLSLKRSSKVIAPSEHLVRLIELWGVSPKKIVLVRNSTDLDLFRPSDHRTLHYDVISVGRLVKWKGFNELIEICSKLKQSLVIVGDGPERKNLEKLVVELGAQVTFLGEVSHEALPELLRESGVFVLNSKYEGSPHSLIEALASGCVSVARDNTGSSEVLHDGIDGFLFKDAQSLENILTKVKRNPGDFEIIRKSARDLAMNNYNREANFQTILDTLLKES